MKVRGCRLAPLLEAATISKKSIAFALSSRPLSNFKTHKFKAGSKNFVGQPAPGETEICLDSSRGSGRQPHHLHLIVRREGSEQCQSTLH